MGESGWGGRVGPCTSLLLLPSYYKYSFWTSHWQIRHNRAGKRFLFDVSIKKRTNPAAPPSFCRSSFFLYFCHSSFFFFFLPLKDPWWKYHPVDGESVKICWIWVPAGQCSASRGSADCAPPRVPRGSVRRNVARIIKVAVLCNQRASSPLRSHDCSTALL